MVAWSCKLWLAVSEGLLNPDLSHLQFIKVLFSEEYYSENSEIVLDFKMIGYKGNLSSFTQSKAFIAYKLFTHRYVEWLLDIVYPLFLGIQAFGVL